PAVRMATERDRERPVVRSDDELERIGPGGIEPRLLIGGGDEAPAALAIGVGIAGADQRGALLAEDGEQGALVERAAGRDERGDGGLRIGKVLLRRHALGWSWPGSCTAERERRGGHDGARRPEGMSGPDS